MENKSIVIQFAEVLKTNPNHAYDFIANNSWKMSKEELANIAKELVYQTKDYVFKSEYEEIMYNVAEELEDQYSED